MTIASFRALKELGADVTARVSPAETKDPHGSGLEIYEGQTAFGLFLMRYIYPFKVRGMPAPTPEEKEATLRAVFSTFQQIGGIAAPIRMDKLLFNLFDRKTLALMAEYGFKLDRTNSYGVGIKEHLAMHNNVEGLEYLLERSIPLIGKTKHNATLLHAYAGVFLVRARQGTRQEIVERNFEPMLGLLDRAGVDFHATVDDGTGKQITAVEVLAIQFPDVADKFRQAIEKYQPKHQNVGADTADEVNVDLPAPTVPSNVASDRQLQGTGLATPNNNVSSNDLGGKVQGGR